MHPIAAGFWGAFFCAAVLLCIAAAVLQARGLRWPAAIALAGSALPVVYALAFLGWLAPAEENLRDRYLAHVGVATAVSLATLLLAALGQLRRGPVTGLALTAVLTLASSWMLPPVAALVESCLYGWGVGIAMLWTSVQYAAQRQRWAMEAVGSVFSIIISQSCLNMAALLAGAAPWPLHALAATSGVVYLVIVAAALWVRVARAMELRQVLALGPSYDPLTRMHAYGEAGKVVSAYFRKATEGHAVGVVALTVANLRALEGLYGRAAHNHALFVTASRLRNSAPMGAELCRLGDDGFLLLMLLRGAEQQDLLVEAARRVRRRVLRPVNLAAPDEAPDPQRNEWTPEIGLGIALTSPELTPGSAVAAARATSRTALGYTSRLALCGSARNEVSEVPEEAELR